jgi:CheY-like chemotaxis protein
VRAVVAAHLKGFGCAVTDVASASEALVLCRSQAQYDILLTDIALSGGMDGRNLAKLVQCCVPGIGVVFMSGDIGAVDADDAEHSRIMLRKPFTQVDLAAALIRAKAQKDAAQPPNPDSR